MAALFGQDVDDGAPLLLNSASPWATTKDDLLALFESPFTVAVTTRTSTLTGFGHDDRIHQYGFFGSDANLVEGSASAPYQSASSCSSLNTLGYSPLPLQTYLQYIPELVSSVQNGRMRSYKRPKPFVVSVTGTAADVAKCISDIQSCSVALGSYPLLVEINLSCPNIEGKPPPAYSKSSLAEYLEAVRLHLSSETRPLKVGIKTPPYTHANQFLDLEAALLDSSNDSQQCPISFITATNTLGGCLVLDTAEDGSSHRPLLSSSNGTGIGGMAGNALHPLSLGNVAQLRRLLDSHDRLRHIEVIGVGGVSDAAGAARMRYAGASAVGLATALGRHGVSIFEYISSGTTKTKATAASHGEN